MTRALALVAMLVACGGAQRTVSYATVASVCTARKQQLVDRRTRPDPTAEEIAAFEATRSVCADLLGRIEAADE